jgi:hypothetical protein
VTDTLVRGLKCRLCGKHYPQEPINFCSEDFGPLEVDYDYEAIARRVKRDDLQRRPFTMWRVPRIVAAGRRTDRRPVCRWYPVVTSPAAGEGPGSAASLDQETMPSTSPRFPSRTAW